MFAGPEIASLSLPQNQNQQGRSSRPSAVREDGCRTLRGGEVSGDGRASALVQSGKGGHSGQPVLQRGKTGSRADVLIWALLPSGTQMHHTSLRLNRAEWHSQAPQGRGFGQSTGSKLGCFPEAPCVQCSGKSGSQWEGKARAWERSVSGQGLLTPRQAEAEQPGGPGWLLLPKDLRAQGSASLGLLYWRPGWPEGKEF